MEPEPTLALASLPATDNDSESTLSRLPMAEQEENSLIAENDFQDTLVADVQPILRCNRFRERLLHAVTILAQYPRQVPYPMFKALSRTERAMSTGFYTILNASDASCLTESLLKFIPAYVQDTFGKNHPTFEDLLRWPAPTSGQLDRWIVYIDCTVRWEMFGEPGQPMKTDRIVRRAKYVGSSVDNRGGSFRVERHYQAALSKKSSEKKQRHHQELCRPGAEANIRILAAFDMNDQIKPHVQLLETIFMAFAGTFVGRERVGTHNPQPCYDLYDKIRTQIPEIEGDGLNGALSIHQGMVGPSLGRQTASCCICLRELPPNSSIRNGSRLVEPGNPLGPRRCAPCERVFARTGFEKAIQPGKATRESHKLWLARGNADVCGNPLCGKPRGVGTNFHGWMEEARCGACHSTRTYYRKLAVSEEDIRERQPTEQEFASRRYQWTAKDDSHLLAARARSKGFKEICSEYFPQLLAQEARERHAVLLAKQRRKRKQTTKKAPDWTEEETNICEQAIKEGIPASKLLEQLPRRNITSIGTKMSWLRKGQKARQT